MEKNCEVVKIWRVEDKYGCGPYDLPDLDFLIAHSEDAEKHPTPYNDIGISRKCEEGEICGFKNRRQLLSWFSIEQLRELRDSGYFLKRIAVREITAIGKFQVLAKRR